MENIALSLKTTAKAPTRAEFDRGAHWIIIAPAGQPQRLPHADLLYQRRSRVQRAPVDKEPLVTELPNKIGTRVAFACIKPELPQFDLLTLARKLVAVMTRDKAGTINALVSGFTPHQRERIGEALYAAVLAAAADLPSFKKKREKPASAKLQMYGVADSPRLLRTRAEAEGNALARHLTVLPSNFLTPTEYMKHVRRLARSHGWKLKFYDLKTLRRMGAGAFCAVAQGSPVPDAGIAHLHYEPRGSRANARAVALVGKGICYDTGGVNLKTQMMYGMHGDMQGSAVALGILHALTRLKVRIPVDCWLALAMNHIGSRAYKPNDVVTAVNGVTIEVVDTDAEGRMVLSDTLALAARRKPRMIIDFATLTGTCKRALGGYMSGVFTNRDLWLHRLIETGRQSGERVWPFPMDEDYDQALESEIADIKQCSNEPGADHINAARLLSRFVDDVPWIHMDLSAGGNKGGLAHIPTNKTGFGVRFTLNLLLDQEIV
jgi:leucyl aminopeptidase